MKQFEAYHPLAVAVYFAAVGGIVMFTMNPVLLGLSLVGALLLFCSLHKGAEGRTHPFSLGLFFVFALVNPLVSHNGVTVLFVLNNRPITLEALVYGAAAGLMITAVCYWFRCFSKVMTSDRVLCLLGAVSPKLAMLLSMALRFVPMLRRQAHRVTQSQTALGLYKEDNLVDQFCGRLRVFSILTTWALENGIVTADSMTARGYDIGKRSRFSVFRWTWGDSLLLGTTLILLGVTMWGISHAAYSYYPAMSLAKPQGAALAGYLAYGLLALLPTTMLWKEELRWRFLLAKM